MMGELLVYESKPLNAAIFGRLSALQLREVRSLLQLRQALAVGPNQFVAIEIQPDHVVAAIPMVRLAKQTGAAVVAMPNSQVRSWDRAMYEAGADLIFRSMLDRERVAGLLRRVDCRRTAVADPDLPFRQLVWSRLPWKRHASAGSR